MLKLTHSKQSLASKNKWIKLSYIYYVVLRKPSRCKNISGRDLGLHSIKIFFEVISPVVCPFNQFKLALPPVGR